MEVIFKCVGIVLSPLELRLDETGDWSKLRPAPWVTGYKELHTIDWWTTKGWKLEKIAKDEAFLEVM